MNTLASAFLKSAAAGFHIKLISSSVNTYLIIIYGSTALPPKNKNKNEWMNEWISCYI